ncbi:MAG: heavy metal-binding domain-containing protein [Tissierellia bacterium]|nr:heavy metal-binding domain-containing protein [Tissierellia bacterium]
MIVTTTNSVEGREIQEYRGIVFGEVITGVNVIKDIGAGLRDFFGGRAQGYETELIEAREEAIQELIERAAMISADAVVGMKMDYEVLGQAGSMLMVTASGTAVKLK